MSGLKARWDLARQFEMDAKFLDNAEFDAKWSWFFKLGLGSAHLHGFFDMDEAKKAFAALRTIDLASDKKPGSGVVKSRDPNVTEN